MTESSPVITADFPQGNPGTAGCCVPNTEGKVHLPMSLMSRSNQQAHPNMVDEDYKITPPPLNPLRDPSLNTTVILQFIHIKTD